MTVPAIDISYARIQLSYGGGLEQLREQLVFFNDTATTEIYTLSLHDALPILPPTKRRSVRASRISISPIRSRGRRRRSEEHTSELQSRLHLVCRLLLEKKKKHEESMTQPCITADASSPS